MHLRATYAGQLALCCAECTVVCMQQRRMIVAVALLAVASAGSLVALWRSSAGSPPATATIQTSTTVSLPLSELPDGPSCLGGVCADALPDQIALSTVGAYLSALRSGLQQARTPEAATTCHELTHEVGRRAAKSTAPDELLDLDDGNCLYGFQHGVLEGWSLASSPEQVRAGIASACSTYDKGYTSGGLTTAEIGYAQGSCAHGVGHAIALQYLPSIREALDWCDPLGAGKRAGCAGGLFMAYGTGDASQSVTFTQSGEPQSRLDMTPEEVKSLCPSLAGEYRSECWAKLWLLAKAVDISVDEVALLCPTSGDDAFACGHGVGVALFYDAGVEWQPAAAACGGAVQSHCLSGVAWANANAHVGSGNSAETYLSICAALAGVDVERCAAEEQGALNGAAPQ